jgi:hypothetical protein
VPKDWQETWMQRLQLFKKKPVPLEWNDYHEMSKIASHVLNYEFHRCNINQTVSQGIDWALVKGCTLVNILWERTGLSPYLWQPEMCGVLREDVNDLQRQEAFVTTSYISFDQFLQRIKDHPEEEKMIKKVKQMARREQPGEQMNNDFYHQIIIGGINTPQQTNNQKASAQIFGMPVPKLDPKVMSNLLVCHTLWVQDDDREDWTTIQMIEPGIVIEGKLQRRNLSGVKGETGFMKICPNEVDGYFWGNSEFTVLKPLQDMVNVRVGDINRILKRRAQPSKVALGMQGDADQIRNAINQPDGLFVDSGPGGRIETIQPDSPTDAFDSLKSTVGMFYEVAGTAPIMRGQGESGVRSGVHAETLVKTGSPRLRDRALAVERQCSDVGDFCLKMLQSKEARAFVTSKGDEFLLSQLPEDVKVTVDSHTSSPAFSDDNRQLAFMLAKAQAIDAESLIEMTHPPMQDELIHRAREKKEMEAKLVQDHPELLSKGKKR